MDVALWTARNAGEDHEALEYMDEEAGDNHEDCRFTAEELCKNAECKEVTCAQASYWEEALNMSREASYTAYKCLLLMDKNIPDHHVDRIPWGPERYKKAYELAANADSEDNKWGKSQCWKEVMETLETLITPQATDTQQVLPAL